MRNRWLVSGLSAVAALLAGLIINLAQPPAAQAAAPYRADLDFSSHPVAYGNEVVATFTVRNETTYAITQTRFQFSLHNLLDIVAADPKCPAEDTWCGIGQQASNGVYYLNPGQIVTLRYRLRPADAGNLFIRGTVAGQGPCGAACPPPYNETTQRYLEVNFEGPLATVDIAVSPQPGLVGGEKIKVTFTIRNRMPKPIYGSSGSTSSPLFQFSLPGQLPVTSDPDCPASPCSAADVIDPDGSHLSAGGVRVFEYWLDAAQAGTFPVRGELTGMHSFCPGSSNCPRRPITVEGNATVQVIAPELTINPEVGPPGIVALVVGTNFPRGGTVRLTWAPGITATGNEVTVGADGTFSWQALVFRGDLLGQRELRAEWVSGPRFAPVTVPFLVTPPRWAPPIPESGW